MGLVAFLIAITAGRRADQTGEGCFSMNALMSMQSMNRVYEIPNRKRLFSGIFADPSQPRANVPTPASLG
jgi:hypothetical protein